MDFTLVEFSSSRALLKDWKHNYISSSRDKSEGKLSSPKVGLITTTISDVIDEAEEDIIERGKVSKGDKAYAWRGSHRWQHQQRWSFRGLPSSESGPWCSPSLELWYNTVLVLLTGYMKNAEVEIDALSICLNINGWEMMISFGFMAAASVRVANELGKGSSKAAKFSIVVAVLTSFSIGFILFLFFLFFRERLAYVFTSNKDVAIAVGDLSPLLAVSLLLNSVQPVLSGVAVGAGWQSIVTYVNIGCYYIIGIPVGVLLGNYMHLQVKGIWIGMMFGTLIQTIVLAIITYKTNWDEQVTIARNRISKWSKVDLDHETITSDN
ncbi:TRANSPARENT TESTA protein 12 [Spatholobus suberectus]|nr:TRANSPARENT TESTA protein 12 [Spatholobus suberectus]